MQIYSQFSKSVKSTSKNIIISKVSAPVDISSTYLIQLISFDI